MEDEEKLSGTYLKGQWSFASSSVTAVIFARVTRKRPCVRYHSFDILGAAVPQIKGALHQYSDLRQLYMFISFQRAVGSLDVELVPKRSPQL